MKKDYKNKRDQYKAERDEFKRENTRLKGRIEKQKTDKRTGLSCTVYCSQCQIVSGVIVPFRQTIHESGCAHCGVRNSGYLVRKVKTY